MKREHHRFIMHLLILAVLVLIAIWVYHGPGYMKVLKEPEDMTQGRAKSLSVVQEAIGYLEADNRQKLKELMQFPERPEMNRLFEPLLGKPFGPVTVLGCRQLKLGSDEECFSVSVHSISQGMTFAFSVRRTSQGDYRIADVSSATNASSGQAE